MQYHTLKLILGVKRVKRDFINDLWTKSSNLKESEWKSSARQHLIEFENQLYEAVDAGIGYSSSVKSNWPLTNYIHYCASLIITLGIDTNFFYQKYISTNYIYIYITPSAISLYFLMVINIRKHGQGKHIRIRQTHNLSLVVLWYSHWNVNNQWIVEAFNLFNSSHLLCSNSASGN